MAVVIKGSGSIEGSTGLEMGANGTTEIRGQVNVAVGSSVAGVSTATNFAPTVIPTSHRNLIINGAMQVAQRATTSTTSGYASLDRYYVQFVGHNEALTHAQHALTSGDTGPWAKGFRNSLHITNGNQTGGAGVGDYSRVVYNIEAQDIANSGWDYSSATSYLTLSYWVKSSVAQNFDGYIRVPDGTAQGYSFQTGALSANTWTKITKTIPGNANLTFDNNTNSGFAITFSLFMGTDFTDAGNNLSTWAAYASGNRMPNNTSTWYTTNDATFEMTGLQLEVGSVATPFEHRSYGDELTKCQRYFWQATKQGSTSDVVNKGLCMVSYVSSSDIRGTLEFPVEMRSEPTLSSNDTTNSWYVNAGTSADLFDRLDLYSATAKRAVVRNSAQVSGTAGQCGFVAQETGDSSLSFSAEI